MRVEVEPARGARIRAVRDEHGVNALAWYDWLTPVPAAGPTGYGTPELDWLSAYRGGWQELVPNVGAACTVLGVPQPVHGEVSIDPWEVLEHSARELRLRARCRLPLLVTRHMRLADHARVLRIDEVIRNESDVEVPFLWAHHPAFPALAGARIDLPAGIVHVDPSVAGDLSPGMTEWPHGKDTQGDAVDLRSVPVATTQRLLYLPDRPAGWAALRQPASAPSVALSWELRTFPHLWMWQQLGANGFPWFGRARVVTLEPASAWPSDGLAAAVERGRAHVLAPGEERSSWITCSLFGATDAPVTSVSRTGEVTTAGARNT